MVDANTAAVGEVGRGRRVFLSGAAGRLGSFLRPVLRAAGHEIVGVDVRREGETGDVREVNLLDGAGVRVAMEGCGAVVHLGNYAGERMRPPAQLFNENVAMTMNVFSAARELGIRRIIFASTVQVIASEWLPGYTARPPRAAYLPLDGASPADPTNTYALSKLVGEMVLHQWATEFELEAASVRFPLLIDPEHPRVKAWRATRHVSKEPSPTSIAQGFSWLSFRDASELLAALLKAEWKGSKVYLPAAPAPRMAESVSELVEKYYAGVPRKAGLEGALSSLVDVSAITRETGWAPQDVKFWES